jgi:hypothetical protein
MLDKLLWHGLGVFCVLCLALLGWRIAKQKPTIRIYTLVISSLVGLFLGVLGAVIFFVLVIFASDKLLWITTIHYMTRIYLAAFGLILFASIGGKTGAYFLSNYFSSKAIFYSALMASLLFILQPIACGWLELIGIL